MTRTVNMTAEEAEALFEAVKSAQRQFKGTIDEAMILARAVSKLRRADVLVIEASE